MGPGWVIGSIEALSGLTTNASTIAGKLTNANTALHFIFWDTLTFSFLAVTKCRLHFISFNNIESLEENNPRLVLKLYKLLSYLMAKRQEVTIGQLGTLHSIMSAPALKKPIGRSRSNHLVHVSSFYE